MRQVNIIELTEEQRSALESGFRTGNSHAFRTRCKAILMKAEGKTASAISIDLKCGIASVFNWMRTFREKGVDGLRTKTGVQRRKPALTEEDRAAIEEKLRKHRQRLKLAKSEWEAESGRSVGYSTLRRFLAVMAQDISE